MADHTRLVPHTFLIEGTPQPTMGLGNAPLAWEETLVAEGKFDLGYPYAVGNTARYGNDTLIQGDDYWCVVPEANALFVLDGVGSLTASHKAAQLTGSILTEALTEHHKTNDPEVMERFLRDTLKRAISQVGDEFGDTGCTTASGVVLVGDAGVYVQVGDSYNIHIHHDGAQRIGKPETYMLTTPKGRREVLANYIGRGGVIALDNVFIKPLTGVSRIVIATDGILRRDYEMEVIRHRIAQLSASDTALVLTNDPVLSVEVLEDGERLLPLNNYLHHRTEPVPPEEGIEILPGIADDRTVGVIDLHSAIS